MNKHYEANKLRSNRKAYRHIFLYASLLSTVAVIGATKVYADDTKESEANSELVAKAPETNQLDRASQDQTVQATDDQVQANQTEKAAEEKVQDQESPATPKATVDEVIAKAAVNVNENNQVMSEEEKQRAIAQMGANQGDVWVWSEENVVEENGERQKRGPNGGPGQFNGGAVVLGGRPTYDPAADWYYLAYKGDGMTDEEAKAVFDKERGKWMNEFDPWGVVMEMTDNKAKNAWADIRNMKAFILRKGATTWDQIVDHPEGVQWVAQFKGNMSSYVEDAKQSALPNQGGTSVEVQTKQDRVAHWGSDQARGIANPETIRAVLVSVEARISEKSDPNAKLGIQVGGDWKFAEEVSKPLWYPGAGLAGIQRLSKDWARYYFVSILGVQDAVPERGISKEEFLSTTVPLPAMAVQASETKPSQQPNNQASTPQQNHPLPNQAEAHSLPGKVENVTAKPKAETPQIKASVGLSKQKLPETGSQSSNPVVWLLGVLSMALGIGMWPSKKEQE